MPNDGNTAAAGASGHVADDGDEEVRVDLNLPIGTVVWVRVAGYPWWPALIVPYETVLFLPPNTPLPSPDPRKLVCQFFSDGRISLVDPASVMLYHQGNNNNLASKGHTFAQQIMHACEAAKAYKKCHKSKSITSINQEKERNNARDEFNTVRGCLDDALERIQQLTEQLHKSEGTVETVRGCLTDALGEIQEQRELNTKLESTVQTQKKTIDDLRAKQNRVKKKVLELVFHKKPEDVMAAAAVARNASANPESNSGTAAAPPNNNIVITPPPPSAPSSSRRNTPRNRNKWSTPIIKPMWRNARRARGGRDVSSSRSNYQRRTADRHSNTNRNRTGNGIGTSSDDGNANINNSNRNSCRHTTSSRPSASASGTQEGQDDKIPVVVLD